MRAYYDGAIDLRNARLHDPRWWRKLWLILDQASRDARCRVNEHKLQLNAALLDYGDTPELFNLHWEQAEFVRNQLVADTMPWAATGPTSKHEVLSDMHKAYVETIGDPADPDYQAEMQKLIKYWENKRHGRRRPATITTGA